MAKSPKDAMTLSRFILRSKSLKLYRDLLRIIKKIPNEEYKKDLKYWVREDFERYRNINDEEVIKYHLSRGKSFHGQLLKSLNLTEYYK